MSERSKILSSQNLQTIVAVAFVLVLVSLGLNFYIFARTNQITAGMLDVEAASIRANAKSEAALQQQITALQGQVAALEGQKAAPAKAEQETPEVDGAKAKAGKKGR